MVWSYSGTEFVVQSPDFTCSRTPFLCSSPSSSDVGNGSDSAEMLHEDHPRNAEIRGYGDVEASVAIQQSGVTAV